MLEISLWTVVLLIEAGLLVVGGSAFVVVRLRGQMRALELELRASQAEVARSQTRPPPEVRWKVVLLSAEDLEGLREAPADDHPMGAVREAVAAWGGVLGELTEMHTMNQEIVETLLQRQTEVVTKLGALVGSDSLSDFHREKGQAILDALRASDPGFIEASDRNFEIADRLIALSAEVVRHGPSGDFCWILPPPAPPQINGLLLSRADGQTEEEFERLREEVQSSLREAPAPAAAAPPPAEGAGDDDYAALLREIRA